jgi:hypothetical protein
MPRGAKPGQANRKGRPNKSTQEVKDRIDLIAAKHKQNGMNGLDAMWLAQLELACGTVKVESLRDGEVKVYQEPPSPAAAKIIIEQRWGKPKESLELSSADEFEGFPVIAIPMLPKKKDG